MFCQVKLIDPFHNTPFFLILIGFKNNVNLRYSSKEIISLRFTCLRKIAYIVYPEAIMKYVLNTLMYGNHINHILIQNRHC